MSPERRIRIVAAVLVGMFALPVAQVARTQMWDAERLDHHKSNSRRLERIAFRGRILEREGNPVAYSQGHRRIYPLGEAAAPLLGYVHPKLGVSGVERWADEELRGETPIRGLSQLWSREQGRQGRDVRLTIEAATQLLAFERMEGHNGALLVMKIASGEILAGCSRPSFRPDRIEADWRKLSVHEHSPLLDRVGQGLYAFPDWARPEQVRESKLVPHWMGIHRLEDGTELVGVLPVAQKFASELSGGAVTPRLLLPPAATRMRSTGVRPPSNLNAADSGGTGAAPTWLGGRFCWFQTGSAPNPDGKSHTTWGIGAWPLAQPHNLAVVVLENENAPETAERILEDLADQL